MQIMHIPINDYAIGTFDSATDMVYQHTIAVYTTRVSA